MALKLIFMGTPEFSLPTLDALKNSEHKILATYSQPASKANRGQKIIPSSVEAFAKRKSLNIRTPENLDTEEAPLELSEEAPAEEENKSE